MKTILVPTDFSKVARNAIDYAVEIARLTRAKLILFHVYNFAVVPAENPSILPMDELEKESLNELHKIEKNIHQKQGSALTIECKTHKGFPIDEINYYVEEHNIDLVVMGMEGAGYLTEKLIGSVTTSLISKCKCPVLAIDKHVKYKSVKKIALACDYKQVMNRSILNPLLELTKLFKAHVYVLNVVPEFETVPTVSKTLERIKFDHMLVSVNHSSHYIENEDIVDGINHFVDENNIDMVVVIPRMHTGFQSFFFEPETKRMAFHSKVPLLALHQQ